MKRPGIVVVVAAFLFLASAIAWITGTSLLFPGPIWQRMWSLNPPAHRAFEAMGMVAGPLLAGVGVLAGAAGVGLIQGRKWAWWLALGLFGINGAGDLVNLLWDQDWVRGGSGVAVAGVFLISLTRPRVVRYFRAAALRRRSSSR